MNDSIFTQIIKGKVPAHIICEDDKNIAFLDINPLKIGHTLIVPKKQVDNIFDLNQESYLSLFDFAKKIAKKIKNKILCKRVGISVIGLDVPHAHIHLIPISSSNDMNFNNEPLKLSQSEMRKICQLIKTSS